MSTITKAIINHQKECDSVCTAIKVFSTGCIPVIERKLFGDEPSTIDFNEFFRVLHDALRKDTDELVSIAMETAAEGDDDCRYTYSREERIAELRDLIIRIRNMIVSIYGRSKAQEYGMKGNTPRNPDMLVSYAFRVSRNLEEKPELGPPSHDYFSFDAPAVIRSLREKAAALQEVLILKDRDLRENQALIAKRNRKEKEWEKLYTGVAQIASALYIIADHERLAKAVRPTHRRRRGLEKDPRGGRSRPAMVLDSKNTIVSVGATGSQSQNSSSPDR
ncbi:MAG: hypothetical protein ACOC41_03890 [Chitinivibrionales bacterium]